MLHNNFFVCKNNLSWLDFLQCNYSWSCCGKMVKAIKVKGRQRLQAVIPSTTKGQSTIAV